MNLSQFFFILLFICNFYLSFNTIVLNHSFIHEFGKFFLAGGGKGHVPPPGPLHTDRLFTCIGSKSICRDFYPLENIERKCDLQHLRIPVLS